MMGATGFEGAKLHRLISLQLLARPQLDPTVSNMIQQLGQQGDFFFFSRKNQDMAGM